jgi:class 3 adenylate cyclase/tetratricopeptide (TPR) repeat protein
MQCPGCQFDNREGVKFCEECGAKFEIVCPTCKADIPFGRKFCGKCGHPLSPVAEALPVDYSQLQSYTPKHLVQKILTNRSAIEGERKLVTVLFADVANYTSIAEKLDPEEIHHIMDGCFKILMDEIHQYEGTINQFTGDGIMALFGAPIAHENHAQRACYAALCIQRKLEDYAKKLKAGYGVEFKMRLGINTGLVMVGAIGNDLRMDYTADGDTTYLASRLESIAEPGNVLLSENTYRLIKAYFKLEALGPVTLKGIKEEQNAYLLIDSSRLRTRFDEAVSKGLVRFVGRKNSMATLGNTWNEAAEGFGQVLGIMGEPGVGKSRLLLEFKRSLDEEDIHFLEGRCLPYGDSIAYLPFLDILKSYFSIQEGQSDSAITKNIKEKITILEKEYSPFLLPAFQQLLSLEIVDASWHQIGPKQRRHHIFEALKWLFLTLSEQKPLVALVDDLQWVDETSEEFLSYFIDSISQNPILLVLLYRPEYTHPWENRSHYSKIGLGQLAKESVVELSSAVLDDVPMEAKLKELILRKCAGNPLFIEEFIHTLLENDYIRKNHQFVLIHGSDSIMIPDTIHGIVAARIDKLDGDLKQIIQAASVIGQNFGYRILQTITGRGEELQLCLDKLRRLEFINERAIFPELEYTFRHALIQEVAYSSLLLKRRTDLHARIGLAAEFLYADKLDEFYEILAYHFSQGEDYPKAYKYLKLSGEKAEEYFSHWPAFHFFEKARKTYDMLPEEDRVDAEKLEICKMMTRPIAMLGFPKGSLKILKEGAKIAKELGDQKSFARFHNDISILYTARGDSLLSIAHSEKSFNEAEKIDDIEIMAPLALSLCYAFVASCRYDKVIDISQRVAGLIEKTERKSEFFNTPFVLYSFLLGISGMAMAMRGDFKKGQRASKKGLDYAEKSGHTMTLAFNELQHASVLVLKGDGQEAMGHCQSTIKYSEDIQWPTILSQGWTIRGYASYLVGELNRARDFVLKGLSIQEDSGIEAMISLHYCTLSMVLFDLDNLEEAHRWSEKALEFSLKNHEKRYEGLSKIWTGRILGSREKAQYIEGEQLIHEGYEILKELGVRPAMAQGLLHLGELYKNSGHEFRAVEHLGKAQSMFEEMKMDFWAAKCREAWKGLQRRGQ